MKFFWKNIQLENTRYMQYVAATTGTLVITSVALHGSWPSPILPKIAAGNSPLGFITPEENSWIVSSMSLGLIIGSITSGWTLETFGRKGSLLISGVPLLLSWYPIAFTNLVWLLCVARFIAGIATGNAFSGVSLYNAEIAEKEVRGRLGSTINMFGLFGEIIPLCVGPYISYRALSLISTSVPLVFLVSFYFMPESPYYLIKVGKIDQARESLKRLLSKNTSDTTLDEQLNVIKSTIDKEMQNKSTLWEFLSNVEYRKSLIISLGVHTIAQLSGFFSILAYMQTILGYSKNSISPEIASMICGIVQIPTVFVAASLVDRSGRKPLLMVSLLGCAIGLIAIGTYFYLLHILHYDVQNLSWIPIAGILLYIVMRPIGIGTLPFVLMGELFTTNIKGHAIAVSMFYKSVLAFGAVKTFEPISNYWGYYVTFGFYALICILGTIFVYFIVPETKGKSFAEIQNKLHKNKEKSIIA